MENGHDDLKLQKDVSGYSSFYKTRLSIPRDDSNVDKNTEENCENECKMNDSTKTDQTKFHDDSDTFKNKTSSDMNNNSNDNKDTITNKKSDSEDNKEIDVQLDETKETSNTEAEESINNLYNNVNKDIEENIYKQLHQGALTDRWDMSTTQNGTQEMSTLGMDTQQGKNYVDNGMVQDKEIIISKENQVDDRQDAVTKIKTNKSVTAMETGAYQHHGNLSKQHDEEGSIASTTTNDGKAKQDISEDETDKGDFLRITRQTSKTSNKENAVDKCAGTENPDIPEVRNISKPTAEEDKTGKEKLETDIGTEISITKEFINQGDANDDIIKQQNSKATKGDHSPVDRDTDDDKQLPKQTGTDNSLQENSGLGMKASVLETFALIDHPVEERENTNKSVEIPLATNFDEKATEPKQSIDLDQMPTVEHEGVKERFSREKTNEYEYHGGEIMSSVKHDIITEAIDNVKFENGDSQEHKETHTLKSEAIAVKEHPDISVQNIDEQIRDRPSTVDQKENFDTQGKVLSSEMQFEHSDTGDVIETCEENADISKSNSSTYDNLYFTGRLPTLISSNESSQTIRTKKTKGKEVIIEDREQAVGTETFKLQEENDQGEGQSDTNKQSPLTFDRVKSNNGESETDFFVRKTPTPSKKIRELIHEMKEPSTSVYSMSREIPLSPKNHFKYNKNQTLSHGINKTDTFPDAVTAVQKENEPMKNESNYDEYESANMTVGDINMVTSKVLGTSYAEDHQSKFDNMPHMKQITNYVQENNEQRPSTAEMADAKELHSSHTNNVEVMTSEKDHKQTLDDRISYENDTLPQRSKKATQLTPKSPSKIKFIESDEEIHRSKQLKTDTIQQSTENPEDKQVQRSSSENDLKAIIASAKMAISNGTDTTESQTGFETSETSNLTLQGDNISLMRKKTRSRATPKGVWNTPSQSDSQEALSSLICSNCLQIDSNVHSAGYCTNCQKYLCNTCITVHTLDTDTRLHEIVPSYCKNELAINKYIPATGYCVDCSMFLCARCVVQHTGFRANRHHRIIQSSFVSKPVDRKIEADEFLDEIQNKMDPNDSKASLHTQKEQKRKRKLLSDLDRANPYSAPFSHIPESLYPGPNKKLASSYTKHPKWAHSSIPNLPYLVQPKPIPDRVFHAAGHHRPVMIYTRPKTGLDAMAVKFKFLKSRYKTKDDVKTARRKEKASFTARPLKARDNCSLPDVRSIKSHITGGRSVKHTVDQNLSTGRKEVEFINEHCLSIPFPRGEKRTDILAMTILLNGKLAVLDKNNNNVKLYDKTFHCTAALQFQNRLVDICASNLCPTDIYAATPKHFYEISAIKGMELTRKVKIEIKRIEGMVCWKYGLAIVSKKTNITWELRLFDYRGNLKSKLEIFNPFTLDIASSTLHHMTASRGGKYISLSDTRNSCVITVDVTTRVVVHETMLEEGKCPTYLTSDGEGSHNLYVSCDNKLFQISRKGKVLGSLIDKARENDEIECIIYNKLNDRLYVKTGKDMISVYQIYF